MYKLCTYRTNVDQQRFEILHHLMSTLEKAKLIPLKLSPEILAQVSQDIGIEGKDIDEFTHKYEEIIEAGNIKWGALQTKLEGRLSVACAQLPRLVPTQPTYLELKQKFHEEIKQLTKENEVLQNK